MKWAKQVPDKAGYWLRLNAGNAAVNGKLLGEEKIRELNEFIKTSRTEQPNQNLMTFEQIDGCCDIIEKLLKELVPKTEQVASCITTHKSWHDNNLKHLRKAFE